MCTLLRGNGKSRVPGHLAVLQVIVTSVLPCRSQSTYPEIDGWVPLQLWMRRKNALAWK